MRLPWQSIGCRLLLWTAEANQDAKHQGRLPCCDSCRQVIVTMAEALKIGADARGGLAELMHAPGASLQATHLIG